MSQKKCPWGRGRAVEAAQEGAGFVQAAEADALLLSWAMALQPVSLWWTSPPGPPLCAVTSSVSAALIPWQPATAARGHRTRGPACPANPYPARVGGLWVLGVLCRAGEPALMVSFCRTS